MLLWATFFGRIIVVWDDKPKASIFKPVSLTLKKKQRHWPTGYQPLLVRNALQAAPCLYRLWCRRVGSLCHPSWWCHKVRGIMELRWSAVSLFLGFLTRDSCCSPQGTFLLCYMVGPYDVKGCLWRMEAKDVAKHPTMSKPTSHLQHRIIWPQCSQGWALRKPGNFS